jgi:CheY-like chemotaxis protein
MIGESAKHVLVVDDDPDICATMQAALEFFGYSVDTARDGAEALQKLRRGDVPFLILLDFMMPGMNGIEFRSEQLRDPSLASIPVVMLSGAGDVAAKAAAVGMEGLNKPVDLDVLLEKVRRFERPRREGRASG